MTKIISAICSVVVLTATVPAQQVPDFSGAYVLKSQLRSDSQGVPPRSTMIVAGRVLTRVVQDSASIEISFLSSGGPITCKYGLDGSETPDTEPDGTPSTVRAKIKGKKLIIQTSIKVRQGALKGIPVERTEEWELSKDLKTLRINQRTEIGGHIHMTDDLQTLVYVRQ
jgi:hypothetical protein